MPGVTTWPYVLGKNVDEAVGIIHQEDPNLTIIPLPEGSPVTYDLNNNRVRIFYNDHRIVSQIPMLGTRQTSAGIGLERENFQYFTKENLHSKTKTNV